MLALDAVGSGWTPDSISDVSCELLLLVPGTGAVGGAGLSATSGLSREGRLDVLCGWPTETVDLSDCAGLAGRTESAWCIYWGLLTVVGTS